MRWNRSLKAGAHPLVAADEVAGDEQQIEEIERAVARLELAVAIERAAQLDLQQRREIGVSVHAQLIDARTQLVTAASTRSRGTPSR